MKKSFIVYPFLLAIFPVLLLFSNNIDELTYDVLYLPLAITFIIALALFFLLKIFIRDISKVGIITSIFVITIFYYGFVYDGISSWHIGDFVFGRHKYLLPLWGLAFIGGFYFSIRTQKNFYNFTKILNVFSSVLVMVSLVNIGIYEFSKPEVDLREIDPQMLASYRAEGDTIAPPEIENIDADKLPDVYYIIPDMYANSNVLNEYFDYNNQEFLDYLSDKGFSVAYESQSNYPMTYFSLASTLNMEYINYLGEILGEDSTDFKLVGQMIEDNMTLRFFKSMGYKSVHLGTDATTFGGKNADIEVVETTLDNFARLLMKKTILRPFGGRYGFRENVISKRVGEGILNLFDKLGDVPDIEGPKFVFAHITSPHGPYVFGRNGEEVKIKFLDTEKDPRKAMPLYLDQLIFINKKLEAVVEQILSKSEIPPIIVIQSDHGINFLPPEIYDEKTRVHTRVRNFSAYYLPGKDKGILPESMTPVNTFRLIFDQYFGTDYGFLENKSYKYNEERSYEFIEIDAVN